jgi:hypothetical protein
MEVKRYFKIMHVSISMVTFVLVLYLTVLLNSVINTCKETEKKISEFLSNEELNASNKSNNINRHNNISEMPENPLTLYEDVLPYNNTSTPKNRHVPFGFTSEISNTADMLYSSSGPISPYQANDFSRRTNSNTNLYRASRSTH